MLEMWKCKPNDDQSQWLCSYATMPLSLKCNANTEKDSRVLVAAAAAAFTVTVIVVVEVPAFTNPFKCSLDFQMEIISVKLITPEQWALCWNFMKKHIREINILKIQWFPQSHTNSICLTPINVFQNCISKSISKWNDYVYDIYREWFPNWTQTNLFNPFTEHGDGYGRKTRAP